MVEVFSAFLAGSAEHSSISPAVGDAMSAFRHSEEHSPKFLPPWLVNWVRLAISGVHIFYVLSPWWTL